MKRLPARSGKKLWIGLSYIEANIVLNALKSYAKDPEAHPLCRHIYKRVRDEVETRRTAND